MNNKILNFMKDHKGIDRAMNGGTLFLEEIINQYIRYSHSPDYPLVLNLDITSQCNTNCLFCSANATSFKNEKDNSNEFIVNKLQDLKSKSLPLIFNLTGGETMLYPNRCIEYFSIFEDKDVIYSILSNMSIKFNEAHLSLLNILANKPYSYIQTSIDTMDKELHNYLRRGSNLDTILSNISYAKNKGIKIRVNTTISEFNYKDIINVVKYVSKEGIDALHINHVLPYGRAKDRLDIGSCFDIIYALMEVISSKEYMEINERSISFPSEIIPFSYIGSKLDDILSVYKETYKEKFVSPHFVCNISHEHDICNTGWVTETEVSLKEHSIIDAFTMNKESSTGIFSKMCNSCMNNNICNTESLYTNECQMQKMYQMIDFIMKHKINPSKEEKTRLLLLKKLEKFKSTISEVIVSVTSNCNGNCNFCHANGSVADKNPYVKLKDISDYLKDSCCLIQITGGEPLIRKKELQKFIVDLKSDGHIVSLLTNLVLIDEEFMDILQKNFTYMDTLQVSIYAHEAELHKKICGRDDWELLNHLIRKIIERKIPIRANLTLTKDNINFIENIYQFYQQIGIDQISINGLINEGRAKNLVNEKYIFQFINNMYEFLIKRTEEDNFTFSIPIEVMKTYANIHYNFFGEENNNNILPITCSQTKINIHNDGKVFSGLTGEEIGCIYKTEINSMQNKLYRDLRDTECEKCISYEFCGGGDLEIIYDRFSNINYSYCDL